MSGNHRDLIPKIQVALTGDDLARAVELLNFYLEQEPTDTALRFTRNQLLFALGKEAQAITDCETIVDASNDSWEILTGIALLKLFNAPRYREDITVTAAIHLTTTKTHTQGVLAYLAECRRMQKKVSLSAYAFAVAQWQPNELAPALRDFFSKFLLSDLHFAHIENFINLMLLPAAQPWLNQEKRIEIKSVKLRELEQELADFTKQQIMDEGRLVALRNNIGLQLLCYGTFANSFFMRKSPKGMRHFNQILQRVADNVNAQIKKLPSSHIMSTTWVGLKIEVARNTEFLTKLNQSFPHIYEVIKVEELLEELLLIAAERPIEYETYFGDDKTAEEFLKDSIHANKVNVYVSRARAIARLPGYSLRMHDTFDALCLLVQAINLDASETFKAIDELITNSYSLDFAVHPILALADGAFFTARGLACLAKNRYQEAYCDFDLVIKQFPDGHWLDAYLGRALAAAYVKYWDQAVRDLVTFINKANQSEHLVDVTLQSKLAELLKKDQLFCAHIKTEHEHLLRKITIWANSGIKSNSFIALPSVSAAFGSHYPPVYISAMTASDYFEIGKMYLKSKNLPEANRCFNEAITLLPTHAGSRIYRCALTVFTCEMRMLNQRSDVVKLVRDDLNAIVDMEADAIEVALHDAIKFIRGCNVARIDITNLLRFCLKQISQRRYQEQLAEGKLALEQKNSEPALRCFKVADDALIAGTEPIESIQQVRATLYLLMTRAHLLSFKQPNPEAEVAIRQAYQLNMQSAVIFKTFLDVLLMNGQYVDICSVVNRQLIPVAGPATANKSLLQSIAQLYLGRVQLLQHNYAQAICDFEVIINAGCDVSKSRMATDIYCQACLYQGLAQDALGNFKQADEIFMRLDHVGSLQEYLTNYRQEFFIKTDTANTNQCLARYHYYLAHAYYRRRQYAAARTELQTAIGCDPANAQAIYLRGMVFAKQKDYISAASDFSQLEKLDPILAREMFYWRGLAYRQLSDMGSKADEDFHRAAYYTPELVMSAAEFAEPGVCFPPEINSNIFQEAAYRIKERNPELKKRRNELLLAVRAKQRESMSTVAAAAASPLLEENNERHAAYISQIEDFLTYVKETHYGASSAAVVALAYAVIGDYAAAQTACRALLCKSMPALLEEEYQQVFLEMVITPECYCWTSNKSELSKHRNLSKLKNDLVSILTQVKTHDVAYQAILFNACVQALCPGTLLGEIFYLPGFYSQPSLDSGHLKVIAHFLEEKLSGLSLDLLTPDTRAMLCAAIRENVVWENELKKCPYITQLLMPILSMEKTVPPVKKFPITHTKPLSANLSQFWSALNALDMPEVAGSVVSHRNLDL